MDARQEGCSLDLMLLVEYVGGDTMSALLPINSMRNYGLIQAKTRLVAMVDVDLLPSTSLHEWMEAPGK
jgi:glycosyltransferase-like protein LARGE